MTIREWDVRRYESIDSTNLEAVRLLEKGASAGLVVTARHQTAGRGRLGREWVDLPGKSLIVSLVLGDTEPFAAAALVAVSARAAVIGLGGEGPLFKWPNDLVYDRRKVGGILSELHDREGGRCVVVGLGMNVSYLPEELRLTSKLPPTSLLVEEGKFFDTEELLCALLREVAERSSRDRGRVWEEYRRYLAYVGRRVRVENFSLHPENTRNGESIAAGVAGLGCLEGTLTGVDEQGNLLVDAGGEICRLLSGDLAPLP